MRAALLLPVFVVVSGGCTRPPVVRVDARRLDGPRPAEVLLRCRAEGLRAPLKFQWKLAPAVKQIGWGAPTDEPTLLVQLPDNAGPVTPWAECAVTGDGNVTVRAARALVPPAVSAAPVKAAPGELVTVRGSGFGPSRNPDDAIYFVPAWGAARAADHACKGATWGDGAVSACVPASVGAGEWQVRVQTSGELAIAATPLKVGK
jgi:hypothetical protein